MISMRAHCRERPGVYVTSYSDLALVLRKHSASPAEDVAALFRHMAFNAAVGNVDDHLKNFWMLNTRSGRPRRSSSVVMFSRLNFAAAAWVGAASSRPKESR